MKGEITNEIDVIRILAKRDGWQEHQLTPSGRWCFSKGAGMDYEQRMDFAMRYTESIDALRPVLLALSHAEWNTLTSMLLRDHDFKDTWAKFYLTLEPKVLAEAVAGAIEETRQKGAL